ncbi:hypothetical protein F53441_11936, partial [Fusarium austroafricanum]
MAFFPCRQKPSCKGHVRDKEEHLVNVPFNAGTLPRLTSRHDLTLFLTLLQHPSAGPSVVLFPLRFLLSPSAPAIPVVHPPKNPLSVGVDFCLGANHSTGISSIGSQFDAPQRLCVAPGARRLWPSNICIASCYRRPPPLAFLGVLTRPTPKRHCRLVLSSLPLTAARPIGVVPAFPVKRRAVQMESSPESVRPLKRVKYVQQDDTTPVNISASGIKVPEGVDRSLVTDAPLFENPWPLTSGFSSPSQVLFNLPEDLGTSWIAPTFTAPQPALNLQVATAPQPQPQPPRSQTQRLPRLLPAAPDALPGRAVESQDSKKRGGEAVEGLVVSPFTANEDRLIVSASPRYHRPKNGQVNGYVKFHWPSRGPSRRPSEPVPLPSEDDVEDITANITRSHTLDRSPSIITLVGPLPAHGISPAPNGTVSPMSIEGGWASASSPILMAGLPVSSQDASLTLTTGEPRMLPPQFGFQAKMDNIDRRLFEFCMLFLPSPWAFTRRRSVLSNTNLWLKDLAPMHNNEGILHAIQSLAGVYIYDYLPDERIRQRINQRYVMADQYFSTLLNAPESRENGKGQEVITMAVLLSMQDVVLTERRLKKPHKPRWLEGFKQGAYFLHATDPGNRYWIDDNTQYNELRISQSIIVGRAVILAQPMMALPAPNTMNPEEEAHKFSWLTYGTEKDMYEIHGGCGFSKKLLHLMSQVTYCAARLQQEPKSAIVPMTATYLMRTLKEMRQWSRE